MNRFDTSNFPKSEGNQVKLKDDRTIGYCEYGNSDGKYIIFFIPGIPGSRFFCPPSTKFHDLNIRLIVLERPGFGLSSSKDDRTLLDFSDDVQEVADLLNIRRYGIIGYSGGGPFALACLSKSPHRIFGAAIISSIAPRDESESKNFSKSMPTFFKFAWWCSANAQWLLRIALKSSYEGYLKNPVSQGREDFGHHCKEDVATYKTPEVEQLFLKSALEISSRKQFDNEFAEWQLFTSYWGFRLNEIKCPNVSVYHGKLDCGTTLEMGEFIHKSIANSRSKFVDGKGHLLIFDIWIEILQTLVSDAQSFESKGTITLEESEDGKEEIGTMKKEKKQKKSKKDKKKRTI